MAQEQNRSTRQEEYKEESNQEALEVLLAPYEVLITYVPLRTEVPFRDYLDISPNVEVVEIPPRASLNPQSEATRVREFAANRNAAILIPGRSFDASGTRHGQGGGWYDRFLSEVPAEWLRIGFCYRKQFSEMPLHRESWDQVMDAVVVVDGNSITLYRTNRV